MLTRLVERTPLFADLRSQGIAEDLVQETLLTVTGRIRDGHPIEDPFAYARQCVTNLAKRTYQRGGRERATGDDALERLAPAIRDVADHVQLRMSTAEVLDMVRLVNGVIDELTPLELELVRAELQRADHKKLAARLGISRPTLYRRKGPAISAFVNAVAAKAGTTPCAEHAGALLAAAAESGFDAARAASEHAAQCAGCRETIRHLTVARHGMAVIAPIPFVAATPDAAGLAERLSAMLHVAGDWARSVLLRIGDPLPLGGGATKTVAIVAAACAGGGGVYCAVDGLPASLAGAPRPAHRTEHANSPPPPAIRAGAAAITPTIRSIDGVVRNVHLATDAARARRAAQRAAARKRALAAAQRRARAAREFAAPKTTTAGPETSEFAAPAAPSTATVRREFAAPSTTTSSGTTQEFGGP